jgi:hypothetical protein
MAYVVECVGATSLPVTAVDLATDCATAGGTVAFVEVSSALPELTLEEGGAIAGAILGLWAFAFCLRAIRNMIEES